MRAARTTIVVCLLAATALAQKTGGSFGGSSKTGGSTGGSTSTGGSRSTGGSTSFTGPSRSMFDDDTPKAPREPSAEEVERRRKNAREEDVWQVTHRAAGKPELTREEASMVNAPYEPLSGLRWPQLIFSGLAFVLLAFSFIVVPYWRESTRDPAPRFSAPTREFVNVPAGTSFIRLSLGFDWSVRSQVQTLLKALSSEPMGTPRARAKVMQNLATRLAPLQQSVAYAFLEERALDAFAADEKLDEERAALELRFETRTVGEGAKHVDVSARDYEGQGLVVVSVLLNVEQRTTAIGSWAPLTRSMRQMASFDSVNSLRVVWSPSEENDRMSSAELEVIYPELQKVRATKLGRVSCASCHAVYAAELGQCPSCGDATNAAAAAGHGVCPYCGTSMPASETKCDSCGAWVSEEPAPRA